MFSREYYEIFENIFLQNFSGGCFCIFLKVIEQLFRKGVNVKLKKCPCYDVLIFFSSQHVLERHRLMYKTSNSFVYKFVNLQVF